jgi:kynurenine formamidase
MTDVRSESEEEARRIVAELSGRLCNWDRWDREDGLGALNLVTPEKRLEASAAIRSGAAFSLGFELQPELPQPPGSGRLNPVHVMTELPSDAPPDYEGPVFADDMLTMAVHAATHWDALSHCFHGGRMYGGISAAEVTATHGAARNDIVPVARRMVTRGVLADVARHRGVEVLPPGEGIDADDLRDVLDAQGVEVRPGDALLVRTGLLGATVASGRWTEFAQCGPDLPNTPGIAPSALPLLHELGVCAIAADNWAVEQLRGGPPAFPVHELALVYMGMILGENFELDALAEACAAAGRHEFFFAGQPLPIRGAVGGPVNPIAVL